jgi:hypothetical protein
MRAVWRVMRGERRHEYVVPDRTILFLHLYMLLQCRLETQNADARAFAGTGDSLSNLLLARSQIKICNVTSLVSLRQFEERLRAYAISFQFSVAGYFLTRKSKGLFIK